MSIKHGLLMSLILGITATLGAVGIGPAAADGASPPPVQLASATPAAAPSAARDAAAESPRILADSEALAQELGAPEPASAAPVQVAANTPAPTASKPVPVVNVTPVGLSVPGQDSPAAVLKGIGLQVASCAELYLNFTANPRTGPAPLEVTFTCDTSIAVNGGPGTFAAPVQGIQWYVNGTLIETKVVAPPGDFANNTTKHIFDQDGLYSIGMRVILENDTGGALVCPPDSEPPFTKQALILVGEDDATAASMEVTDLLCTIDGGSILPLADWIPLLAIKMDYNPEQPAPRVMAYLNYSISSVGGGPVGNGLNERDIVQYAMFANTGGDGGVADDILDLGVDGHISYDVFPGVGGNRFSPRIVAGTPMLEWQSNGFPYEMPRADGTTDFFDLDYNLNFVFDVNNASYNPAAPFNVLGPQRPFIKTTRDLEAQNNGPRLNWPVAWNTDTGWGYIIAFKPAASFPTGVSTFRVRVGISEPDGLAASFMLPYSGDRRQFFGDAVDAALPLRASDEPLTNPGVDVEPIPFNQSGPVDSYTPNFFEGDALAEECSVSSSFDVWDLTGGLIWESKVYVPTPVPGVWNNSSLRSQWNWPNKLYTPVLEHTRPRWDLGDTLVEFVTGEWMDIRRVFSVEEWYPVIGINAHGTANQDCNVRLRLRDINVILTDVGADPFGPPGNGGFDPRTQLEHMTTERHGSIGPTVGDMSAEGLDYTFNGVGVFSDTGSGDPCGLPDANCGGNGVFDPPTPFDPSGAGAGVGFTDLPLVPKTIGGIDFQNQGYYEWEYIPFPPGGGDPWWRMRLRFSTGHRTVYTDDEGNPVMTTVDANADSDFGARGFIACDGQLELTPDLDPDLFVVIRPDSGFGDVSGLPGDGTGMSFGTDMRAFIEPRSWNPLDGGHWDGGMTFNVESIEPDVRLISEVEEQKYWQDNANSDIVSVTCDGYDGCTVNSFGAPQAWLNERTQTQDNVKPIRCGIDVHDYTLTYSSNNRYARQSHIGIGQRMYYEFPLIGGSTGDIFEVPQLPVNLGLITPDTAVTLSQTAFSLWMDPPVNRTSDEIFDTTGRIGILQALGFTATGFAHIDSVGVSADRSNGFSPVDDELTEIQYAYETVPFALDPDVGFTNENVPVSKFYTNPAEQPNLPDYLNWSPLQREVAGGPNSFCYLLSEGTLANQPFRNPTSSGSEATYADDEYVFVCSEVERGNITDVQPNMWLVDRYGGRYRILAVNGDELTIQRGHGAYLDRFFQFPTRAGASEVNLPDWPYGVQIGSDFAVARGAWSIVPDALVRNEYPRQSDWPEGLSSNPSPGEPARAARLLKQHIMQESQPNAVLGFNLAGVADPRVNAAGEVTLRSITVAFWGPEFKPNHLNKLDENGQLVASGVLLYEDTNGEAGGIRGSGVFDGPIFSDLSATPAFRDQIVPLQGGSLQWSATAEPVDLDGDYKGDDLSGDGLAIYTNADLNNYTAEERAKWDNLYDSAWVLRIQPAGWVLPHTDFNSTLLGLANDKSAEITPELPEVSLDFTKPDYWVKDPKIVDFGPLFNLKAAGQKSLGSAGNFGDDLFVVVRTSDEVKSFENFRVVVPARLPNRTSDADKLAGVQLSPRNYVGVSSFEKQSPDEGPVQDFYGHDMLEVSVPTRVIDMTGTLPPNPLAPAISRLITPGGPPFAALGIDASQNRPENVIAAGDTATLQNNAFTTGAFTTTPVAPYYVNGDWTSEAAGLWVIAFSEAEKEQDARIEAYEITAASGKNLTLRAGTPAVDRPWRIVKDPTFLEEVIVELYDRNSDGGFDITQDLLPLNFEDPANDQYSGVSVWRDNDDPDAGGTNGVYDAPIFDEAGKFIRYIDLPVRLDDAPNLIGAAGETSYQVRMVFSSPGTDDSTGRNTKPYEEQPLLRQPIPQTFGRAESDADFGPDFFVVLRTSRNMDGADDVQAAIVSWGPDTPTQPDPDNFTVSLSGSETPGQREDEFDLFDEFPHAARGLGFISFFKDPQPIRYWSYDRDKRKTVPRTEVDHSQDNNEVKHWVRSRANVAKRTPILIALPSPVVDFTADRHRQIVDGEVKFTLIATGDVEQILWDFGDGTTDTARDPIHKFAAKGFYDIKVTVRDQYGIEDQELKEDYIEIVDLPLADFSGTPTDATLLYEEAKNPPIGRDVAFVDLSLGDDNFIPVRWAWNFGDGTSEVTTTKATEAAPLIHRYTQTGFYTVTLETTFTDNATSATVRKIAQIRDYITIRPCVGCPGAEGEGEGEGQTDIPAADFSIATEIRDKEALAPLSDWVPLVNFTMSYGEDDPAPRNLQYLRLLLRPDGRAPEDLGYQNINGPQSTDLLEFGLFFETKNDDDAKNNELNIENDFLLYKWDADGGPVGTIEDEGFGFIRYFLDFIGNGTPAEPQFPVPAGPDSDANIAGYSYVLAVRTSATWRSQITMRCDVELARMITPTSGSFPVDDEGAPIDSYSPNFYDNEILEDEAAYSSSFDVWSIVGTAGGVPGQDQGEGFGVGEYDTWSNGRVLYTPLAEHSRPRWNAPGHLINAVGGEFLELRSLVGLEQWLPVVGINAHSTAPVHIYDGTNGPRTYFENLAQLSEVNLVVTDIGGDPFGPPGNGGFNPMDMLHRESLDTVNSGSNDYAIGSDVTFSGAWVWHDTNNNSLFDPPAGNGDIGGATYSGDRPMSPDYATAWEYVPLPPGGGDPWWKIKLGFFGGTRQVVAGSPAEEGFLEKVPDRINPFAGDSFVGSSEYTLDYFVVLRPDSGTQDSSTLAGDGSGMAPGADFRAFIEPRRFNAISGNYDGGIYLDSMTAPQGFVLTTGEIIDPWQNDSRWGTYEPWWPQRTVNANATQKVQSGVEVHDLVMTYETDSPYGVVSNLFFGQGSYTEEHSCLGYSIPGEELTDFDLWMDPLGLLSGQFLNRHTVGVTRVGLEFTANFRLTFGDVVDDSLTFALVEDGSQFAFETAPFSNGYDGILTPRSAAYPLPPSQPTLPEYATWSFDLAPGEYPRASQWADASSKARLLTQKTDIEGDVTGILGINLAGTADPFVNRGTPPALRSITVAFWGPDFDPSKLAALDPNGETPTAGVTLWEDADKEGFQSSGPFSFGLSTGTFIPPTTMQDYLQFQDAGGLLDLFDKPVTLRNLAWGSRAELVDLDGDGVSDDMNGDGVVDGSDKAWVLSITPRVAWQVPQNDLYSVLLSEFYTACPTLSGDKNVMNPGGTFVRDHESNDQKQIDVTGRGAGDDLFIAIRTSDRLSRFEKFRAIVPATLPERAEGQRIGGIQFTTGPAMSLQAALKSNPDEDPEQDFYGHDMLEVNVPTRILDQTSQSQTIVIGGAATPSLALDLATNLDLTVDSGADGSGAEKTFTVTGKAWTPNAFATAHWLVDSRYEAYQIVSNTANQLQLLSGTPRGGKWRIVKDPSFFEQLIVEFYNEGVDAEFNPALDLLPLNRDQQLSGVALYRDNDNDPANRNGLFDPGVDLPINLDAAPAFVGSSGSDMQVKFVFSSPGTDDYAGATRDSSGNLIAGGGVALAEQARNRQWVPDTFGNTTSDPNTGADFFVVVRAGANMTPNDNFRMGIVNWGPNTPTEPDPDTWAALSGNERNDFSKFEEFPWGQRGIGFISFFGTPPGRYYLDGAKAGYKADNSGYNWIRSHTTKKRRTGAIKAITRPLNANSLVIDSASQTTLPPQILPDDNFQVVIRGRGFGTSPDVHLSGYTVEVLGASDTAIDLRLRTTPEVVPQEPIVLIISNLAKNETQSRSDLFTLEQVSTDGPRITAVVPARAKASDFPVTVVGQNFPALDKVRVYFGLALMNAVSVSPDGKSILVQLPTGGLPGDGIRNVTVQELKANQTVAAQDILIDGFYYDNPVVTPTKALFCAPGGPAGESSRGDWAIISITLLTLAGLTLRRRAAR